MVVCAGGGEHRFFNATKQDLDQRTVATMMWKQGFAPVIARWMSVKRSGIGETVIVRAGQGLEWQAKLAD